MAARKKCQDIGANLLLPSLGKTLKDDPLVDQPASYAFAFSFFPAILQFEPLVGGVKINMPVCF